MKIEIENPKKFNLDMWQRNGNRNKSLQADTPIDIAVPSKDGGVKSMKNIKVKITQRVWF